MAEEKRNGRPPKYATEDKLADKILAYFEQVVVLKEIPNKAGLRVYLDIDKSTYSDYKKKFPDPIKKAEELIENAWVQRLNGNSPTGAIFYLKNAFREDYRDRTETDITSGGQPITGMQIIKE